MHVCACRQVRPPHDHVDGPSVHISSMGEGYRCRPYYAKCTGSHPNSEVKRREAGLVLRWGTARETPVSTAFLFFCFSASP